MMYESALQLGSRHEQVPWENRKYPIVDFELVKQCGTTVVGWQHSEIIMLQREHQHWTIKGDSVTFFGISAAIRISD